MARKKEAPDPLVDALLERLAVQVTTESLAGLLEDKAHDTLGLVALALVWLQISNRRQVVLSVKRALADHLRRVERLGKKRGR